MGTSKGDTDDQSLLRISLTAGFTSLFKKKHPEVVLNYAEKRNWSDHNAIKCATIASHQNSLGRVVGDESSKCRISLLASSDNDVKTLALIDAAQCAAANAINSRSSCSISDPKSIAALSAVTIQMLHGRGVMVNVIDPTMTVTTGRMVEGCTLTVDTPSHHSPGKAGVGLLGVLGGGESNACAEFVDKTNWGDCNYSVNDADDICLPRDLYGRLSSTFTARHGSVLRDLSYLHPRTSVRSKLPPLPVLLASTMRPSMDPADWHLGPYCHVYVAAVGGIEHYRSRVRPALRAFVNQIEGSGTTVASASNTKIEGGDTNSGHSPPTATGASSIPGGEVSSSSPAKGNKLSANEKLLTRAGLVVGKSIAAGKFGSRYVIVIVPIGCAASSARAGSGGGKNCTANAGGGFGGFRAGRRGKADVLMVSSPQPGRDDTSGVSNNQLTATSVTSLLTHNSGGYNQDIKKNIDSNDVALAVPPLEAAVHPSREARELYQKFLKDFPNGRSVIMETLSNDSASLGTASSVNLLMDQEWKVFLHCLGGAVMDGFQDRVGWYTEELRRMDSDRTVVVSKLLRDERSDFWKLATYRAGDPHNRTDFNLSHYFLVKESLAFTYEQMQLFEEAKLQYKELNALLPEHAWQLQQNSREYKNRCRGTENLKNTSLPSSLDLAMAGDSDRFRHHIRISGKDLCSILQYLPYYMYSRESRLLFQMGVPSAVKVLLLSKNFVVHSYRNQLLNFETNFRRWWLEAIETASIDSLSQDILENLIKLRSKTVRAAVNAETRIASSCWDINIASANYFPFAKISEIMTKHQGKGKHQFQIFVEQNNIAMADQSSIEEIESAQCLAELIEFVIFQLIRLGDLVLIDQGEIRDKCFEVCVNSIRQAMSERPIDTLNPWGSWQEEFRASPRKKKDFFGDCVDQWPSIVSKTGTHSWLRDAMRNASINEVIYLELSHVAIILNARAGRHRVASRFRDHSAEILNVQVEYTLGAQVFSSIIGASVRDKWAQLHCWRIFRLACSQRMSGVILAYFKTLTQSFNPMLLSMTPEKSKLVFQSDLEAMISDVMVVGTRWSAFSFLEMELSIESEGASLLPSQPMPYLKQRLAKHLCFIGEKLRFPFSINSHLPQPIPINDVRLYLVSLEKYQFIYRRNGIITEQDAFQILTVNAPASILPGRNKFFFEWQPISVDLYVLATVEIQCKEASFFYDSALQCKPMIGLEVYPSEPTQTIELNPLFLIPGHVQNIRLMFNSGSDAIIDGEVRLVCSRGLLVVPPKTDPSKLDDAWTDECVITLDACGPGDKIIFTTLVKSSLLKFEHDVDMFQTLWAKVETRYHKASYISASHNGGNSEADPMKSLLEATVTTLDRPALAIQDATSFAFGDNHVMVNILLLFHSPISFFIKEWHLGFPPPLAVNIDNYLNMGLFHHAVPEGEVLLLGFKCFQMNSSVIEESCEKPLLRVVLQDDFGKTFQQVLPLNLEHIYIKLLKKDTVSAVLTSSSEKGCVGFPVHFVYHLNIQSLKKSQQTAMAFVGNSSLLKILYSIVSDDSEWVVSGKVQGIIVPEAETILLHFQGIPTQSGLIRNFPLLQLEYLPGPKIESFQTPLHVIVLCKNPHCFQSFSHTSSLSLAIPSMGIEG